MPAKPLFQNLKDRLLARGERGVALLGMATAVLLVLCLAADGWIADRANGDAAAEQRVTQIKVIGPLLAETAKRLIGEGDLIALRRLTAGVASGAKAGTCTVSIGSGRILADGTPGRVNTFMVPEKWTVEPDAVVPDPTAFRFPFAVPGRGAGFVELAAGAAAPREGLWGGSTAVVCAIGLGVLVYVYRRSRAGLAEMEIVRSALQAAGDGEPAADALKVDPRLGPAAAAWNGVLTEVETLRQRVRTHAAVTTAGNRRVGGNNLEAACDAMSQGLVLVDEKMCVRFSNGAAGTFLKRGDDSLIGVAAVDLIGDHKFRDAMQSIAAGKLRRPVVLELEHASESGNGELRVCIRPVRRGDADSAMIIIEDITQQRTAERARNQFINQVTHELRTPLTNIRLYTETAIEDGESNPEVRANCLNVINQESRRLERIVSEMLSVAEIEAGSTMIRRDEIYFDAMVKDLQNDYQAQANDKQITLEFNVSPKIPKLEADKDKLAIAMHNLIGNALKYTPEGGKVTVGVDVRDGQLAIDVADTGIGIEAAESEKIFDRFFRSADPRVGKIVGTGLGLTLAREVMRLHGGDITVQSVINRGSTFTATMPVAMAA